MICCTIEQNFSGQTLLESLWFSIGERLPCFLINSFPKIVLTKNITPIIYIAASTGSHDKYMMYVSFPWRVQQALHNSGCNWLLENCSYIPRIQLCLRDPTFSFRLCRGRSPIKIDFAMTISQLKGRPLYMLECIHHRVFLPMASYMWLFPDPRHFTTSLLQLLKGVNSI
jgi:hypothetical protein